VGASGVVAAGLLAAGCASANPSAAPAGSTGPGGTAAPTSTPPRGAPLPSSAPAPGEPGGSGGATPTVSPGSAGVYRLGAADAGKQVVLAVGDRLEITLPSNRLNGRWIITGYPRAALRLELQGATFGKFVFVATAAGSGNVTLVRGTCGRVPDRPCVDRPVPVEGAPPATDPAKRTFTVAVRVS
jgi:hypothetical protein